MSAVLAWPGLVTVTRRDLMVVGRFHAPHRVLSTAFTGGGARDDVTSFYNHQSCEPTGHADAVGTRLVEDADALHRDRCREHELAPASTVGLGTAASMRCLGVAERSYRDLRLAAICTAGVDGNGGRAGDPASTFEVGGRFERIAPHHQPEPGTIVTVLLANQEFTGGALARALMTATEAKAALLQDLVVGSRYSAGVATGTGTDQALIACPVGDAHPLEGAGHHAMAGQLISEAVYDAIEQALVLQNGFERSARRSLLAQLSRFGVTQAGLVAASRHLLPPGDADLFEANLLGIDVDPHVVAAGAGLAEVADQLRNRILPQTCAADYAETFGAVLAVAAAGRQAGLDEMRAELAASVEGGAIVDVAGLVASALCLGFRHKWRHLDAPADR